MTTCVISEHEVLLDNIFLLSTLIWIFSKVFTVLNKLKNVLTSPQLATTESDLLGANDNVGKIPVERLKGDSVVEKMFLAF